MTRTLALLLALAASPALADKVTIFVPQESGGVVERIGNVSPQEAALAMGLDAPPAGATGLILEEGEPPRWTDRTATEVNEDYHGTGRPEIEPFNPTEVAEDAARGGILPRSGTWRTALVSQNRGTCPPEIIAAVMAEETGFDSLVQQLAPTAPFSPR
ncbi:MAG: hypothetical protein ACU0CI_14340 [Shimia sp.]